MRNVRDILDEIKNNAHHLTEIRDELRQLVTEMTLIDNRGIHADRRLMSIDLDNLSELTADLSAFRESGISNSQVEGATEHLKSLVKEMRKKSCQALSNRSYDILAHASISSPEASGDAEEHDVTKSFRTLTATESPRPAHDYNLIVDDLGFPEMGGMAGGVEGKAYYMKHPESLSHDKRVAPQDSVLIPENCFVRLNEGERVVVHSAGMNEGRQIGLENYDDEQDSVLMTAGEGGIVLRGPITFSPISGDKCPDPMAMKQILKDMKKKGLDIFLHKYRLGVGILSGAFFIMSSLMLLSNLFHDRLQENILIFYFMAVFTGGLMLSFGIPFIISSWKRFLPKRKDEKHHKMIRDQLIRLNNKNSKTFNVDAYHHALDIFQNEVHEANNLRVYPKRKLVVDQNKGIMIMKPLLSLPKPEPVFADNIIPLKERAT